MRKNVVQPDRLQVTI